MSNTIVLRMAMMEDIPTLGRLYREMHNFHAANVPDRLVCISDTNDIHEGTDLYQEVKKIIQNGDSAIFIAEVDHQTVGLAEIHIRQDEANPHTISYRYGYLQSLMVDAGYRNRGIGTRLVTAVEQWAKEKGIYEVRLNIWEFAEGPLEFYEQIGYRTLKRIMVHQIIEDIRR